MSKLDAFLGFGMCFSIVIFYVLLLPIVLGAGMAAIQFLKELAR